MKILYLSLSPVPSRAANSVQVVKMCAAFARAGHELHLFCRDHPDGSGTAGTQVDFQTLQRTYGIDAEFAVTAVSPPRVRARFITRALYARRVARKAATIADRFELVYGRDLYALLLARRWKRPIVYEAHMPPSNAAKRLMHRILFTDESFVRLVVVSERLAEYYRATFSELRHKDVVVAPNGAEPPPPEPPAWGHAGGHGRKRHSVGYIGQLHEHKGVALVLELARALPDIEFHVVGGAPDDIEGFRAAAPGNLRFHGHVDQTTLAEFYRSFKVVLAPYRRARTRRLTDDTEWGSPLKIFEYMAHGCCIVASDLPVVRELVGDGEAALLCPPDDLGAWKQALELLLDSPHRRGELSRRAEARFRSLYTRDARVTTVLSGIGFE